MRKLLLILASFILALGTSIGLAPNALAANPGTGPVSISHGFKFTPTPGAQTWGGALPNWCTITAVGNDTADRLIAITAGHCLANQQPGAPIYAYNNNFPQPPSQAIGNLRSKNEDANFDYAVIELIPTRVTMHQNGPNTSKVDGISAPAVGQEVCKVGATTGKSCGKVTEVKPNGDVITTTLQASGGDSGSPLIVTATNDVIASLRGPQQACPFCPTTGTLFKNLPRNLAQIPAGQPGSGFTITTNP